MIKLGPHCLTPTADALRLAKDSTLALLVDDFGPAEQMRALNPGIIIIGRSYSPFDARSQFVQGWTAIEAATVFINSPRQWEIYELNPSVKIWTGHNEFNPANAEEMAWYAAFEVERLRLLSEMGLRGCIGNFSVGTPDLSLWPYFYPAIRECILQNGILGVHEYFSMWVWWMTGKFQVNPAEDEGDTGWTTLRYRKAVRSFPTELQEVQVAVTEFGADLVTPTPPQFPGANGNWRNLIQYWNQHDGQGDLIDYWRGPERDPERYYAEQLIWYEKELRKDPQVIGATIFTVGYNNPAWQNFDIAGTRVVDRLEEYARTAPPIDDTPDEPPTHEDGENGDDDMTINLLHNPDLFSGGFGSLPGHDNMRVPFEWTFNWHDGGIELEGQAAPFLAPEMVYRSNDGRAGTEMLSEAEHSLYLDLPSIPVVWHVFKAWGVQWWSLLQTLTLPAGRYRLSVELYPDIYDSDEATGARLWAPDPLSGEWRLVTPTTGEWLNGGTTLPLGTPPRHQFGRWVMLSQEFEHPGGALTIGLECRARWGVRTVGFFVRRFSLVTVGETPLPDDTTGSIAADLDTIIAVATRAKSKLQPAQTLARDLADLLGNLANNS